MLFAIIFYTMYLSIIPYIRVIIKFILVIPDILVEKLNNLQTPRALDVPTIPRNFKSFVPTRLLN